MSEVTDKLKELNARHNGMQKTYGMIEPAFREIQGVMIPTRGRFRNQIKSQTKETGYNKRIIDSKAQLSGRVAVSGLSAGMTSPSQPWFKVGLMDRDASDNQAVKEWLDIVESRIYDVLRAGNTYRMFTNCYQDLVFFGTFGGLIRSDFENVMHTHSFPIGTYRYAANDEGLVDTFHYKTTKTVKQMVDKYGIENCSDNVKQKFKSSNYYDQIEIHHAIEPRGAANPDSKLATDMIMASYEWEDGETKQFLLESGYGVNNILAPRWESMEGADPWPTSWPALLALGDTIQLQNQHRDKAQAIQTMYKPPMIAPAGFQKRFRNVPGGVTTMSTMDLQKGGLRPAVQVNPDVNALSFDIQETRQRISQAFFEDLFLMTANSDRRQVTATEIAERHEEKLLVLGPVLESMNNELLTKVITAAYHYMQEADILPPAPEAIAGQSLKIEYISVLAQAQKAIGVAAIERTLGFAGTLAQFKPSVLDILDEDDMMREFAHQVGPPAKTLRSEADVKKLREQRAQEEAQQQMIESAEPLANTAKLISEANLRGQEALNQAQTI